MGYLGRESFEPRSSSHPGQQHSKTPSLRKINEARKEKEKVNFSMM
jgi:hypothetical protein